MSKMTEITARVTKIKAGHHIERHFKVVIHTEKRNDREHHVVADRIFHVHFDNLSNYIKALFIKEQIAVADATNLSLNEYPICNMLDWDNIRPQLGDHIKIEGSGFGASPECIGELTGIFDHNGNSIVS